MEFYPNINKLTSTAIKAALNAGNELMKGFGGTFQIDSKEGRNNLVTEYDFKAEKLIIDCIKSDFPNSDFLAEESGKTGQNSGKLRWIIDPLDGTVNYAHGVPIFSVSIAAELEGDIVSAVILQPAQNELFYAQKGSGAYLNGKKISVSKTNELEIAYVVTGFPYELENDYELIMTHFGKFITRGIPVRRLGSAALDLAYVAAGRFDLFWEINLNPWDVAAGLLLVKEAGGIVSNYKGEEFVIPDKSIIASNPSLHSEIVELLKV